MVESLCCSPEKITALLIGYTPIQNKKLKKKRKRKKSQPGVDKWYIMKYMCLWVKQKQSTVILNLKSAIIIYDFILIFKLDEMTLNNEI